MTTPFRLPAVARDALAQYAVSGDEQREAMARVRRLGDDGLTVRHRSHGADPDAMSAAINDSLRIWQAHFGLQAGVAAEAVYVASARATSRNPKATRTSGPSWPAAQKAADLEAQATVIALVLRQRKAPIDAATFDGLTAAWLAAGYTLPFSRPARPAAKPADGDPPGAVSAAGPVAGGGDRSDDTPASRPVLTGHRDQPAT